MILLASMLRAACFVTGERRSTDEHQHGGPRRPAVRCDLHCKLQQARLITCAGQQAEDWPRRTWHAQLQPGSRAWEFINVEFT